ncbi:MAG: hypothetical protein RLY93_19660 [Sumerlaeia bacterium]
MSRKPNRKAKSTAAKSSPAPEAQKPSAPLAQPTPAPTPPRPIPPLSVLVVGAVALVLFWTAFWPAIGAGLTLMDDSTLNHAVYKWQNDEVGLGGLLHPPSVQGGARYTPTYWVVKVMALETFGYAPRALHFLHLLMCYVALGVVPFLAAWRFRTWPVAILPLGFFVLTSGTNWGATIWNLYDISTYDPNGGAFVALAAVFLERLLRHDSPRKLALWGTLFFLSSLAAAHSKETVALSLLLCAPLLALAAWRLPARRRSLLLACGLLAGASAVFFLGFFASGAFSASRSNDYTSDYMLSPRVILSNAWFTARFAVAQMGPAIALVLLAFGTWVLCDWRRREDKTPSALEATAAAVLAAALIFTAVQWPTKSLPELPRLLYIPAVLWALFVSLVLAQIPGWSRTLLGDRPFRPVVAWGIIALACLPLPLAIPRATSFAAFYRTVLTGEWKAVEMAEEYFQKFPSRKLYVLSPETDSYFWGLRLHLANQDLNPDGRLNLLPPQKLGSLPRGGAALVLFRDPNNLVKLRDAYRIGKVQSLQPSAEGFIADASFGGAFRWVTGRNQEFLKAQPISSGTGILLSPP